MGKIQSFLKYWWVTTTEEYLLISGWRGGGSTEGGFCFLFLFSFPKHSFHFCYTIISSLSATCSLWLSLFSFSLSFHSDLLSLLLKIGWFFYFCIIFILLVDKQTIWTFFFLSNNPLPTSCIFCRSHTGQLCLGWEGRIFFFFLFFFVFSFLFSLCLSTQHLDVALWTLSNSVLGGG